MVSHDGATYIKPVQTHAADSWAASANASSGVDCRGFRQALVIVNAGAMVSGGTLDVTIQESSDDGSSDAYVAVTGATFTQITAANDNALYIGRVDLTKRERYIRVLGTGATQVCEYSTCVLLYEHLDGGWQTVSYVFAV